MSLYEPKGVKPSSVQLNLLEEQRWWSYFFKPLKANLESWKLPPVPVFITHSRVAPVAIGG